VSIIVASLIGSVTSPIDFLLDTNAIVFIGMFTIAAGLALPVIAIRAGSRRQQRSPRQETRAPAYANYSNQIPFFGQASPEQAPRASSVTMLGADQHGINREATDLHRNEIFHVGAIHRARSGENK